MSYGNGQHPEAAHIPGSSDALERVTDPEDYSALKLVRAVWEHRDTVLERKGLAYEAMWEGRIGLEDYQKAVRMAVEDFIRQSQWTIRRHKYSQWFWRGEPPTVDGSDPFERDEDGKIVTDDDGRPKLRALRPDESVTLPNDEQMPAAEVAASERYTLKRPLLMAEDEDGRLPFGTEPNLLGALDIPQQDRRIPFVGLKSVLDFPDPLEVTWEETGPHPQRIREKKQKRAIYQLPVEVSMAAFDQVCEFWESHAGLGLDDDRGLPRQTGINFAEGEKGRVEHGDPY